MKKNVILLFILLLSNKAFNQTVCNQNGNLLIYSNYYGGILNISVDQDIPNLKIGICTYDAVEINFSGPYVANITGVIYAGASVSSSGITSTTINGVSSSLVSIYSSESDNVALTNYFGEPAYSGGPPLVNCMCGAGANCSDQNSGGANSSSQIALFFLAEFGPGTLLYSHLTQSADFNNLNVNVSNGGNCCLTTPTTPANPIYTGGSTYNFIIPTQISLCNGPVTIDLSSYPVIYQPTLYPGYVWSDGSTGPIVTFSTPGIYSFYVGDYCHFSTQTFLRDTIEIIECDTCLTFSSSLEVLQNVSCFGGNDGSAQLNIAGGTAPYTINWNPGGISGPIQTNLSADSYNVTVVDSNNCSSTHFFDITEPTSLPELTINTTKSDCNENNGSISVTCAGGTSPYTFDWTILGSSGNTLNNLAPGSYDFIVTDNNGCAVLGNAVVEIVENAIVSINPNTITLNSGESDQLNVTGGEFYTWQPTNGLSCNNCPNPIVSPITSTNYVVTIIDSNGCVITKTLYVNVNSPNCLFIPNIFSPNLDLKNDQLCLYGSCLKSGTFTIYNRWGEKVFETTDIKQCWDGTYKGEPVGSDVFVYKLNGVLVTGEVVEESGNIEVVR